MQQELSAYDLINIFIKKCIDTRKLTYRNLKSAHQKCRKALEEKISKNPDLQRIITNHNGEYLWTKDMIIAYIFLKMSNNAAMQTVEPSETASRRKK